LKSSEELTNLEVYLLNRLWNFQGNGFSTSTHHSLQNRLKQASTEAQMRCQIFQKGMTLGMKSRFICILLVFLAMSGCSIDAPNGSVAITPSNAATYLLSHFDELAGSGQEITQPGLSDCENHTDKIIDALIKQLPNLGHLLDGKEKGEESSYAVNRPDLSKAPNDLRLLADYMSAHFEELDNDRDGQVTLEDLQRTARYTHDVFEYICANIYQLGHKSGSHKDRYGKDINEYSIGREDLQKLAKPVTSPTPEGTRDQTSSPVNPASSTTTPASSTTTPASSTTTPASSTTTPASSTTTPHPPLVTSANQSFLYDTLAPWIFGLSLFANVLLLLAVLYYRHKLG
jgi:cell division septation protein DedD